MFIGAEGNFGLGNGSCDEVDGQPVPEEEVGKATKVRIQLCFLFKVLVKEYHSYSNA